MTNKNLLIVLIIAVVISLGYWFVIQPQTAVAPTTDTEKTTTPATKTSEANTKISLPTAKTTATPKTETYLPGSTNNPLVQVIYTSTGFAPASLVIKKGQKVRFLNHGSVLGMWVATTEPVYPGFEQGSVAAVGESYEFTFDKVGTWPYLNRLNPAKTGVIIVK